MDMLVFAYYIYARDNNFFSRNYINKGFAAALGGAALVDRIYRINRVYRALNITRSNNS